MRKMTFLTGMAAGYVLGARAGRPRYEQIMRTVDELRGNPKVQETVSQLQEQAGSLAAQAKEKVESRRQRQDQPETEVEYEVVEMPATGYTPTGNGTV